MRSLEVFFTFLRLGLTSFGGPVAHLSYFHHEFVDKKKWIDDAAYADLVALCQFLPGPASSQVGMAIGLTRAGVLGSILAWIGFTLPSAVILVLFGLGFSQLDNTLHQNWLHALKVAAVAVVAQAVYGMAKKICLDKERILVALISAAIVLFVSYPMVQILVLILGAFFGHYFLKTPAQPQVKLMPSKISKKKSFWFLITFIFLLVFLPIMRVVFPFHAFELFDSFYRAGAMVYGGGHVVLPMLETEVVQLGLVSKDLFMAGYGLAQAIPGPLFSFSGFLGAVSSKAPNGILGACLSLVAIFLPGYLLILGSHTYWDKLRSFRKEMMGINAAVVGILLAALYRPVFTSAIFEIKDLLLALSGFVLLEFFKAPSWLVVLLFVGVSFVIY